MFIWNSINSELSDIFQCLGFRPGYIARSKTETYTERQDPTSCLSMSCLFYHVSVLDLADKGYGEYQVPTAPEGKAETKLFF